MMDETPPPPRPPPSGPDGYSRLSTLEVENQTAGDTASAAGTAAATTTSIHDTIATQRENLIRYIHDVHQQLESACQEIDWNRIYMTAFLTLSTVLILSAFVFPFWRSERVADRLENSEFLLSSLTISEFNASAAGVTGRCDAVLNVSNCGGRGVYHEDSAVSVFLDHELLWVTRTRGFVVEGGKRVAFNVSMNTTTITVPASFVPTALLESRRMRNPLHFKLKYDGMVREASGAWHVDRSHVYLVCGWIMMQFVSDSVIVGGPASCNFEKF